MVNHTNSQNQWEKYHFSIDKRTQKYYTNIKEGEVIPMKSMERLRKLKGFTLVELVVVMAIIAILAAIASLGVSAFARNARLETLNDRAQLVYMAFQDMLTDCEINQDNSIFEPRGKEGAESTDDILGAVVFFRISQYDHNGYENVSGAAGLGDEIHLMTKHKNTPTNEFIAGTKVCSRSVWPDSSTNPGITDGSYGGYNPSADHGASYWEEFNKYISGRLDASAEGTYVVSVDLENYQVLSVICRNVPTDGKDPKTGLYDAGEVADSSKALGNFILPYGEGDNTLTSGGATVVPPQRTYILKNIDHQRDISKKGGVDIGAYPYGDSLYDNVTNPM